jgi:starch synthase
MALGIQSGTIRPKGVTILGATMKILMAVSEAVPYVKTGGLADAVSALSLSLAGLGHEIKIVLPRYYGIDRGKLRLLDGPMGVPMAGEEW